MSQKKHDGLVISGIDLSSYGLDIGTNLAVLCASVEKCGIMFELSSIEVGIIKPAFLEVLRECKNFVPKFHVPLQSGSNAVLRDMNRKYTREQYLTAINLLREYFPDAQISTDVIIGYPTETPVDLADTEDMIKRVGYYHVHRFPYSDRHLDRFKNKK
jgi:threonylcarbamoyladenosine tRNA methylthiotransferase MtaB